MKLTSLILLIPLLYACSQQKDSDQKNEAEDLVHPEKKNSTYHFSVNNIYFEVDTNAGGRVSSLKLDNKELLYVSRDSNNNNWGSTFWPSPQSLWGWPPPVVLDNHPYHSFIKKDTVILHSEEAPLPKISVGKAFSVSGKDTSITIVYSIYNASDTAIKSSAWEITRVPSGGHFLFPKGSDKPRGELAPLTKDSIGAVWLDYDSTTIPAGVPKLFADGSEGWIAYVNNARQVLIKKFADSPLSLKAPEPENEIELYTHPDKYYVEVEQQGPYSVVEPKMTHSWTVKWYAREVPAGVEISLGSPSLLMFIRGVVNK